MPSNCYEILLEADRIPEAAMFARAYLPSKLGQVIKLWKEKAKDKPYVPTALSDVPEHLSTIDLAIRIESVLSEYYSHDKPSASQFDQAFESHFKEISQLVDEGKDIGLVVNSSVSHTTQETIHKEEHDDEPETHPEDQHEHQPEEHTEEQPVDEDY